MATRTSPIVTTRHSSGFQFRNHLFYILDQIRLQIGADSFCGGQGQTTMRRRI
jgi:hypothetical protein